MPGERTTTPQDAIAALVRAMNDHDVDAFVALFAQDYDSRQPAHPDRAFVGTGPVRANWSSIFDGVPDFRAELVAAQAGEDTMWTEWRWQGTHADGTRLDMAGVIVFGFRDGLIASARLYVEPVEDDGAGIRAAVSRIAGTD
jgi:hypothetical protein